MITAVKYRIYPNPEQTEVFDQHFDAVRFVYNWGLEQKLLDLQLKRRVRTYVDLGKEITVMRKSLPWLAKINSQSLQSTLKNLDSGFTKFFKGEARIPVFKNKKYGRRSFQCVQNVKINWKKNSISLPKIKNINAKLHRNIKGKYLTTTISKNEDGRYYASINIDLQKDHPETAVPIEATTIGIDVGIKTSLTLSDGRTFQSPKAKKQNLKRLKFLEAKRNSKQENSKRYEKANLRVAKLHSKIARQRIDWIHKTTHDLTNEKQVETICIEDLATDEMVEQGKGKFASQILDEGWGIFFRTLEYKCQNKGINILKIGRFEPSSRLCTCGIVNKDLTLADRIWTCRHCKTTHDRDLLAANNIKRFALSKQNTEGHSGIYAQVYPEKKNGCSAIRSPVL